MTAVVDKGFQTVDENLGVDYTLIRGRLSHSESMMPLLGLSLSQT